MNSKIVFTSVLLVALFAAAAPASLRTDQSELLESRRASTTMQQNMMACDEANCNGNKQCKEGKCVCKDGFTGSNCEKSACKCNPLGGACDATSGACICEAGFKRSSMLRF